MSFFFRYYFYIEFKKSPFVTREKESHRKTNTSHLLSNIILPIIVEIREYRYRPYFFLVDRDRKWSLFCF